MGGGQWMVVIIVAMSLIAGVYKARYGHERRPKHGGLPDPDAARLRDEVGTLNERIAVLERIATDRSNTLDHEIERLRDR